MVRFTSSERFLSQWGVGTDLFIGAVRDGDQCIALIARDGLTDEQATSNAERIVAALSQTAGVAEGKVIVPLFPTPEMDAAGKAALSDNGVDNVEDSDALVCYAAMVRAAPAASGGERAPLSERLYRGPAHDPSGRERGTEPQATPQSIPSAASGGEDDRSGWCRSDGCVHKKFGEPTWKEGDNPFQSSPHPDALPDGTLSKSTAKRVEALAASGVDISHVTIDFPQVGTAGPFKVIDGRMTLPDVTMNDLIHHARMGYVPASNPPSAASVSERIAEVIEQARKFVASDKAPESTRDQVIDMIQNGIEQALTQQRGECVPEGWRVVPIEPNWDMRNEGREFLIDGLHKEPEKLAYFLWKTMVAAAPEVE